MRYFYSLIMYLLTPYLLFRLWWKGRRLPSYRCRIKERFCWGKAPYIHFDVWLHAVSLGEVIAAIPLIEQLLVNQHRLLITTMTPTGAERAIEHFGTRIMHRYIPYDLPHILRRFFRIYRPTVGVIMETEIWPNLITQARVANIPLLLINARLSNYSYQAYRYGKYFFKPLLNQFIAILAQSDIDAERFCQLGADRARVTVVGNMKFDLHLDSLALNPCETLKTRWGKTRPVVIAASTHDDEELQLLTHFKVLQVAIKQVILLIAPRHPERFQQVFKLAQQMGFNTGVRSQLATIKPTNDVIVLDSLGELLHFYQLSDYAFVGGSLVEVGGHNVLEPIALGIPVLTGQYMHNSQAICQKLLAAKALIVVNDSQALNEQLIHLHTNPRLKTEMVNNAHQVFMDNQGALTRYVTKIEALLC